MHSQLRLFTHQLFLDFRAIFFPKWPLNFFVITIHQVIWSSPGILHAPLPDSFHLVICTLNFSRQSSCVDVYTKKAEIPRALHTTHKNTTFQKCWRKLNQNQSELNFEPVFNLFPEDPVKNVFFVEQVDSKKLAFSAAVVCMKVDYGLRMHQMEGTFRI